MGSWIQRSSLRADLLTIAAVLVVRAAAVVLGAGAGFLTGKVFVENATRYYFGPGGRGFQERPIWGPAFVVALTALGTGIGWRLTAWMKLLFRRGSPTARTAVSPRQVLKAGWTATATLSVGVLVPVLSLPALGRCRDECQRFGLLCGICLLMAFSAAVGLAITANDASVGTQPRPWSHLTLQGWPSSVAIQVALVSFSLAVALLLWELMDLPLLLGLAVGSLASWLVVLARSLRRLDLQGLRRLWLDDRVLVVDLRPIVLALSLVVLTCTALLLSWREILLSRQL